VHSSEQCCTVIISTRLFRACIAYSGPSCMLSTQHSAATGKSCNGLAAVTSNCRTNSTDLMSPVPQLAIWSSLRGAHLSCQHLQHCRESLRYDVRHLCWCFLSCKPVTARIVSLPHRQLCIFKLECMSRFQWPHLPF